MVGATRGTAEGFPMPPELSEPLWELVANKSPALAPAQMLVSVSSRGGGGQWECLLQMQAIKNTLFTDNLKTIIKTTKSLLFHINMYPKF